MDSRQIISTQHPDWVVAARRFSFDLGDWLDKQFLKCIRFLWRKLTGAGAGRSGASELRMFPKPEKEMGQTFQTVLETLGPMERQVFICRYWYLDSSQEIAERFGLSRRKVRHMLDHFRKALDRCQTRTGADAEGEKASAG